MRDNDCQVLVLSSDSSRQGHLHHSSESRLLPDFGSPLLTATQSPELCSHTAHMWVLISTSMDTALHVSVSGTSECQPQRVSVRISTVIGLIGFAR